MAQTKGTAAGASWLCCCWPSKWHCRKELEVVDSGRSSEGLEVCEGEREMERGRGKERKKKEKGERKKMKK